MAEYTSTTQRSEPRSHGDFRTLWPLWLLVIFVSIQFGAGLYEKTAIVPLWAHVPGDTVLEQLHATGMYHASRAFWPYVSPAVAILAVLNLVSAWRSGSGAVHRRWWLAAAVLMTCYATFSYSYFVPQMLILQSSGQSWSASRVESFVDWWTGLNYLRMTIGAAGWLCALRALSLSALATQRQSAPHPLALGQDQADLGKA